MYYATRAIKTKEARTWENSILKLLEQHPELLRIAHEWKLHGGIFHITITNNYPRHLYYNRFGQISAKTFDITNCEKPLVDLIMNRYMGVDDRFLTVCTSSKGPVEASNSIDVTLELI